MEHPVSIETLHSLLRLDPETSTLYWRERGPEWFKSGHGRYTAEHNAKIWNAKHAGREAFTAKDHASRAGRIFRRLYKAHVVIFALTHGHWPTAEEMLYQNNTSGSPGVTRRASGNWRASLFLGGGVVDLGTFPKREDAVRARRAAMDRHGVTGRSGRKVA